MSERERDITCACERESVCERERKRKHAALDRILTRQGHRACHTQLQQHLQMMTDLFKQEKNNSAG